MHGPKARYPSTRQPTPRPPRASSVADPRPRHSPCSSSSSQCLPLPTTLAHRTRRDQMRSAGQLPFAWISHPARLCRGRMWFQCARRAHQPTFEIDVDVSDAVVQRPTRRRGRLDFCRLRGVPRRTASSRVRFRCFSMRCRSRRSETMSGQCTLPSTDAAHACTKHLFGRCAKARLAFSGRPASLATNPIAPRVAAVVA